MDKFTGKCVQKKRTAQSLRRFVCDDNEIALSGYSGCLCSSPCFFGYERSLARIAGTFTQDGGGLPGPADLAGADSDRLSAGRKKRKGPPPTAAREEGRRAAGAPRTPHGEGHI